MLKILKIESCTGASSPTTWAPSSPAPARGSVWQRRSTQAATRGSGARQQGSAEQGGVPQRHVAAHGSEAPRGARAGTRGSGGGGSARVDGSGVGERRLGEIDEARV